LLEYAYAKINLGLNVLEKRNDGYHEVDMVMQSISLMDEIEIRKDDKLVVKTDNSALEGGKTNLAYKAAILMASRFNKKPLVHIYLKKNIFLAAGLAGGSSDAAAVLRGLNRFWKLNLSLNELEILASELGSDVPFCIRGGTARATGRGEKIEALKDFPSSFVVLAKPKFEISTAFVYQNYNQDGNFKRANIDLLCKAIANQDKEIENGLQKGRSLQPFTCHMANVLENVTIKKHPIIAVLKEKMLDLGAEFSMMSGSGPTVFGLVSKKETGARIIEFLEKKYDVEVTLCETVKRSDKK
jgi:4-diphosphocytidyl-2-C-methyl-D-erythritol kinase